MGYGALPATVEEEVAEINAYLATKDNVIKCDSTETKGRIAVSSKAFSAGQEIYVEAPLAIVQEDHSNKSFKKTQELVSKHSFDYEVLWYWCALNCLTEEDMENVEAPGDLKMVTKVQQRRLMLLFTPSTTKPSQAVLLITQALFKCDKEKTQAIALTLERLLQIWIHNCFEHSEDPPAYSTYFMSCFHSHSCAPNVGWHYSGDNFVLRARQDIQAGEELCITYLPEEGLYESTVERRADLQTTKGFECGCDRCASAWDTSRGFRCDCGGVRFLASETSVTSDEKQCSPCNNAACTKAPDRAALQKIMEEEEKLVKMFRKFENNTTDVQTTKAKEVLGNSEKNFPQHWVTERMWNWMQNGCTRHRKYADAITFADRRAGFMEKAYTGLNGAAAWCIEEWASLTVRECGVEPNNMGNKQSFEKVKSGDAMILYDRALHILINMFGTEHEFYVDVKSKVDQLKEAAKKVGVTL
mmetsp:Transcript_28470/g.64590  ORF Transcript_28470/g.64590 Transcript_28470/m.64590 type:complete len:471 (-) Transcript_28470:171-1583(-)